MARIRPLLGIAALTVTLALVSGCAAEEPDRAVAPPTASSAPSVEPSPSITPVTPVGRPDDLTCETLIAPDVAAAFADAGWAAQEDVFRIASREIPDGLWCTWGAAGAVTASVQIYGWAGIDADDAKQAQADLLDDGWVSEQTDEGLYVTENPDMTVATDDAGYGMTFLFASGWVAVSDTKEGLLVIQPPE